jgi:hypothetical protein
MHRWKGSGKPPTWFPGLGATVVLLAGVAFALVGAGDARHPIFCQEPGVVPFGLSAVGDSQVI